MKPILNLWGIWCIDPEDRCSGWMPYFVDFEDVEGASPPWKAFRSKMEADLFAGTIEDWRYEARRLPPEICTDSAQFIVQEEYGEN